MSNTGGDVPIRAVECQGIAILEHAMRRCGFREVDIAEVDAFERRAVGEHDAALGRGALPSGEADGFKRTAVREHRFDIAELRDVHPGKVEFC